MGSLKLVQSVVNIVEVKDMILDHFDSVDATTNSKEGILEVSFSAENNGGPDYGDGDYEVNIRVILFPSSKDSKSRQGIHLLGYEDHYDLESRLVDAVESCMRDGFSTIFIH